MIQRAVIRVSDIRKAIEGIPGTTELRVVLEDRRSGDSYYCDPVEISSAQEIRPQSESFSLTIKCELRGGQ